MKMYAVLHCKISKEDLAMLEFWDDPNPESG